MMSNGLLLAHKRVMSSALADEEVAPHMKDCEMQKYGIYLTQLSDEQIEKLLASVLHELRRRDFEHMKGDFLDRSKALRKSQAGH